MEHKFDSTKRFSSRVDNYIKYRPGYPHEIITFLHKKGILTPGSLLADVGSGTGISAQLFLDNGNRVWGIEPNTEMREAAERLLAGYRNFMSVNGTAENTGLKEASVDLVLAGQAFHWFDVEAAKKEFSRILKPGGYCLLLWNDRKNDSTPFLVEYDELLHRLCVDYTEVNHKNVGAEAMDRFYGKGNWQQEIFSNAQHFDLEGLKGRLFSSSYAPPAGHPHHQPLVNALEELFHKYKTGGKVSLDYDTRLFYGRPD